MFLNGAIVKRSLAILPVQPDLANANQHQQADAGNVRRLTLLSFAE